MAAEMAPWVRTKSRLMVGLSERPEEVCAVMRDLVAAGCAMLTIGQYLAPSTAHLPMQGFVPPAVLDEYRE